MYCPILTLGVFVYLYKTITRMYSTNQNNVRKCSYSFLNISVAIMMFMISLLKCYQANLCDEEWHSEIYAQLLFVLQWRGMTFWNWCSIIVFDLMKLKLNCKTMMPNCKIGRSALRSIFFAIHIVSKIHFQNDNLYFKWCICEIWEQEFWEATNLN